MGILTLTQEVTNTGTMASQDDDYIDAIFGDMDKNNDGRISSQELFQALAKNKNKPKNYEIQKMFDEIDADQTGDIDYKEFKELASRWMHILSTGVPETSNFSNKRAKQGGLVLLARLLTL